MKTNFKVIKKLKNIEKRVQAVKNMYDITFLTGKISKDMKKEVDMRFRNEVDPDGKPWKGLSLNSLYRRQGLSKDEGSYSGLRRRGWKNKQMKSAFKLRDDQISSFRRGINKKTKKRAKILQDQGHLRRSINARHTRTEAIVGTNVKYAAVHNFGYPKRNIPQRRFMGLNRGQRTKYRDWIIKWKKGQLR